MAKTSFFAERRAQNNDPNFFDHMSADELRKSVKRIVRDLKFDNIVHNDYVYFTNPKVLEACLSESYNQFKTAQTMMNALIYYINEPLKQGIVPNKSINVVDERITASNELSKQTTRCNVWLTLYQMFNSIYYNKAEVKTTLAPIQNMQFNVNDL